MIIRVLIAVVLAVPAYFIPCGIIFICSSRTAIRIKNTFTG